MENFIEFVSVYARIKATGGFESQISGIISTAKAFIAPAGSASGDYWVKESILMLTSGIIASTCTYRKATASHCRYAPDVLMPIMTPGTWPSARCQGSVELLNSTTTFSTSNMYKWPPGQANPVMQA